MDRSRAWSPATHGGDTALSSVLAALSVVEQSLLGGLATALIEEHTTVEQWRVLELVDTLPAPTMGELSAASGLPNASLSRVVDALEDDASVYRLVDTVDRRRIAVHLSDRGSQRLSRMRAIVAAWEAGMRRSLGDEPLDALADAVDGLLTQLAPETPLQSRPRDSNT
ncbi:MarR family winged helix-turn-helix transcriptional regulator [Leifsonia sp. NPDC058248]|uniref:MarR family winged helix-turn-helix transcriptional regulator n=1 Tax=Leifsonia sp. NPDC058248 TaxID=3346402 RepID=UPI0036DBCF79